MTSPTRIVTPFGVGDQRQVIRFGGLGLPGTGATMTWLDLNDGVAVLASESVALTGKHILTQRQQLQWQAAGVFTGVDFQVRDYKIPIVFNTANGDFSSFIARMSMAGEQYLTFDNVTGVRCRFNGFAESKDSQGSYPYFYEVVLEFVCQNSFAEDLAGTSSQTYTNLTGGPGGDAYNTINVNVGGNVFTKPIAQISVPGFSGTFSQVDFSGPDGLDISILWAGGGGGHTFTLDSLMQRVLVDATEFPPNGTFPTLVAGNNAVGINIHASTHISGITATVSWMNRYEMV